MKKILKFAGAALLAALVGVAYTPIKTFAQNPMLVFGSSSGTAQVIKATSNALWVSLQGGPFTGQLTAPVGCTTIPYSFTGRTDTGICSGGAGRVDIYNSGSNTWTFSSTGNLAAQGAQTLGVGGTLTIGTTASGAVIWSGVGRLDNVADGVFRFVNNAQSGITRLILGTNDATTNGASWNVNGGTLEAKTGDGSTYTSVNMSGAQFTNIISRYNNSVTAGLGVPAIYGENASTTQTANFTALTQTPTASAGRWECSAVIYSDAGTNTGTFQVTLDYVNANGITHTADIFPLYGAAGTLAASQTDVASKEFKTVPMRFTVDNSNTNIVLKVVITGTVSYKVSPRCSREA